ncbi:MAG: sigma-70 family RNA polymerase sigma factor [Clostridium sp.]|nr:sigma-70 family RNA polymerase sigma factor [Clostridium sp.]
MKNNHNYKIDVEGTVRKYADMVYRIACLNSKTISEAEDAFQEVFLKLYIHSDKINDEQHLKAWLIRVTLNQCKSMSMSAWNRHIVPIKFAERMEAESEYKDYSDLYKAIKQLSKKYREIIYLYYYEEMKIKEISNVLNCPEATIKTRLARGRRLLNEQLKGEYGDGEI